MLFHKIILFANLFFILKLNCSANEALNFKMIKDFQNHFNAKWVIIHSCMKKNTCQVGNLLKELKMATNFYTTFYDLEDFIKLKDLQRPLYARPLVFLSCEGCGDDCLAQVSK